ncbi:MAG: substrate-binding domain-containing protein [Proteocatella sp.]
MKKHWKMITLYILIVTVFVSLIYMYPSTTENDVWEIVLITKTNDQENGFWNTLRKGAEMSAQEHGVRLEIKGPESESDIFEQNRLIMEAIEEKPDAIVLAAADMEKTMPAALKIKENGIRLILIDSGLKEKIEDAMIGTDNFKAGIRMGAELKKYVGKDGKLAIISFVSNAKSAIDRERGVRKVFNGEEDRILETQYCNSDAKMAYEQTKKMLEKNPDIGAIAGLNQYSAEGAARAVVELGRKGKVKIVGIDNSKMQIHYLEEGVFEALVVQKAINMGYLGVEKAVDILEGRNVALNTDSGSLLVNKENMYIGMYQKALFPFLEE